MLGLTVPSAGCRLQVCDYGSEKLLKLLFTNEQAWWHRWSPSMQDAWPPPLPGKKMKAQSSQATCQSCIASGDRAGLEFRSVSSGAQHPASDSLASPTPQGVPESSAPQPGCSTHMGRPEEKQLCLEGNKNVFFLAKQISLHLVMHK